MVEGKGGGRKKREGEGEAKLRYETMENLAIPPPSLSVVSVHGRTTGFRFLLPPSSSSSSSPTLSLSSCGKRGGGQRLDAAHR